MNVTIPLSLGQVNDAVEIEKGISYTPVTGKNLNEDGAVVSKYGCMHLYGFYPQKPVNYKSCVGPCLNSSSVWRLVLRVCKFDFMVKTR